MDNIYPGFDRTIRLIVTGSCQSGCNFCHLEGNRPAGSYTLHPDISGWKDKTTQTPLIERLSYPIDDEDIDFVLKVSKLLQINEIHLTGGEPTLHPQLNQIISDLKRHHLNVAMTTHGEYSQDKLESLFKSGLDKIIFSLHCTNEEEYLSMDLVAQQIQDRYGLERSLIYAQNKLNMKMANIKKSLDRTKSFSFLKVAANHVIRNFSPALSVIRFSNEIGLTLRLQRDLNKSEESSEITQEIISILNAKKIFEEENNIESSTRATYQYKAGKDKVGFFIVKNSGPVYLPMVCDHCSLKETVRCRERYYGIRVQKGFIRFCIDRHDEGVLYGYKSFLNNENGIVDVLRHHYNL